MTGIAPESPKTERASLGIAANLDVATIAASGIAFCVAMTVQPSVLCGEGMHASVLYRVLGFGCCIGLLTAGALAIGFRKSRASRVGLALACVLVTPVAAIVLLAQSSSLGIGWGDSSGERPVLQDSLRKMSRQPAEGSHAYWLGRTFRDVGVYTAFNRDVIGVGVNYYAYGVLEVGVRTYPGALPAEVQARLKPGRTAVVHTRSGQDVVIEQRQPYRPDAALLAEAAAAVQQIPGDVTYGGCG